MGFGYYNNWWTLKEYVLSHGMNKNAGDTNKLIMRNFCIYKTLAVIL